MALKVTTVTDTHTNTHKHSCTHADMQICRHTHTHRRIQKAPHKEPNNIKRGRKKVI